MKMSRIKRKIRKYLSRMDYRVLFAGVAVVIVLILILVGVRGCGVSHKTPEGVAEALVKAGVEGKESAMKDCYGAKKNTPEDLQAEIDATIKYYKAHNVKSLKIENCDVLSEDQNYTYVYVVYNLVLENSQEYPCVTTYMVEKDGKKYYVLPASEITDEMNQQAAVDYAKFMTTDIYKNYTKAYDTFIKKNPGYEDKIAGKLI
jgi:hypothetical protein